MTGIKWSLLTATRDRWRTAIIVGTAVVVTLTVAAAVGAVSTRLQVRATALASLRNYATVATEQFVNAYESLLRQNFAPIMPPPGVHYPVGQGDPIPVTDMLEMIQLMARDPCRCLLSPGPSALFRFGPAPQDAVVTDSLGATIGPLNALVRATIERQSDSLAAIGARYGFTAIPLGSRAEFAFFTFRRDSAGARYYYGFVVPSSHVRDRIFQPAFENIRLVPRHLVHAVTTNDDYLEIEIVAPDAHVLFTTGSRYRGGPEDTLTLPGVRGGFLVTARLNPAVKNALIPGGVPGAFPVREIAMSSLALLMTLAIAALGLRAADLARVRSEFAHNVTHELRTPLTQIRLAAETVVLGRARSPESTVLSMESVVAETLRLQQLVDNVLHISRAERSDTALNSTPVELRRIVVEATDGFAPLIVDRGITLRVDVSDHIKVRVNEAAMRQILLNILDNAARYGPDGQTIVVSATRRDDRIDVSVSDEGPGIPAQERGRVWRAYVRLDVARRLVPTGTGLGLAVVRELVESMEGSYRLEDAPGGGLRVVISLRQAGGVA